MPNRRSPEQTFVIVCELAHTHTGPPSFTMFHVRQHRPMTDASSCLSRPHHTRARHATPQSPSHQVHKRPRSKYPRSDRCRQPTKMATLGHARAVGERSPPAHLVLTGHATHPTGASSRRDPTSPNKDLPRPNAATPKHESRQSIRPPGSPPHAMRARQARVTLTGRIHATYGHHARTVSARTLPQLHPHVRRIHHRAAVAARHTRIPDNHATHRSCASRGATHAVVRSNSCDALHTPLPSAICAPSCLLRRRTRPSTSSSQGSTVTRGGPAARLKPYNGYPRSVDASVKQNIMRAAAR